MTLLPSDPRRRAERNGHVLAGLGVAAWTTRTWTRQVDAVLIDIDAVQVARCGDALDVMRLRAPLDHLASRVTAWLGGSPHTRLQTPPPGGPGIDPAGWWGQALYDIAVDHERLATATPPAYVTAVTRDSTSITVYLTAGDRRVRWRQPMSQDWISWTDNARLWLDAGAPVRGADP